jgi:hypothetical protein
VRRSRERRPPRQPLHEFRSSGDCDLARSNSGRMVQCDAGSRSLLRRPRIPPLLRAARGAFLLPTLRTPPPFRQIFEPRIPATQSPERTRSRDPLMTARLAFEDQRVLTEFVAEAGHVGDCNEPERASPSSTRTKKTLYKSFFVSALRFAACLPLLHLPYASRKRTSSQRSRVCQEED